MKQVLLIVGIFMALAVQVAAQPDLDLVKLERSRVLTAANQYLKEKPVTITASHSSRSVGGPHDFFSEGDYWWPDPNSPGGPYIQRDGMSNPDNFVEHRGALMRFSIQVPALTRRSCRTCLNDFVRRTARRPAPTVDWDLGWPS